jgi:uncharacterized protein YjbI with pentapeptide repeats
MNKEDFLSQPEREFENEQFRNLEITESIILSKEFIDCSFEDCNFSQSTFKSCTFQNCTFGKCNFSLVKIPNCQFNEVTFNSSKIIGIDWTVANWKKLMNKKAFPIVFKDSVINYSIFIGLNLTRAKFIKCIAREVYFEEVNLTSADFSDTDLTDSVFRDSSLLETDLSKAKNYRIDVTKNNISKAKFSFPEAISLVYALDIEIVE